MRTLSPLAVLLPLILAACGESGPFPTEPVSAGVVFAAKGHTSPEGRPFTGKCETTFNPPPLPLPRTHQQVDTGTCRFTHLGRSSIYGEQEINFAAGTQRGTRTITAANGDLLFVENAGTSRPAGPGLVRFSAIMTFVGGTGRFADATGEARAEGLANLITHRTTIDIVEGWIAYDAGGRR